MNITTEIQDTDTQTFCDDCTGAMTPDAAGEWITCPNARDTCIDCCPCCGTGLFFDFGGRVFPAVFIGVAFGMLGHALIPAIPLSLAIACGVLGITLTVARDGWIALFIAVAIVGDITVLGPLCLIILPAWLIVRTAPEMVIKPEPGLLDPTRG